MVECLGRGGMGIVYKARQKSLDRLVALKILAPEREKDPDFAARFAREAKTLAQLNHPNIVTVHDFGEAGGMFYLVMEFVNGVNLRHLLRDRRLAPEEALAIVPPVCEALQYAHDRGVVHRDIKPENLLLDREGRIKIADFGVAKILGGDVPAAAEADKREVVGTPQYMAPEQVGQPRKVDHRADIYSLGVVLYEMLTGELPAGKFEPPSRKVRVDVRIDDIVLRALEKKPELRYQQASQVKTAVETIATEMGSHALSPEAMGEPLPGTAETVPIVAFDLRAVRWLARVLGTVWGLDFVLFLSRDGLPVVSDHLPPVPIGVYAAILAMMLGGLIAGWWRDGLAAVLTLGGWALFFAVDGTLTQAWLYVPAVVGMLYFWSWILSPAGTAQTAAGEASPPGALSAVAQRLVDVPAKRLMVLGVVGLVATLLVRVRGYTSDAIFFGLLQFESVQWWRIPVSLPVGGWQTLLFLWSLLPACYLVVALGACRMRRLQHYWLARASAALGMIAPPLFPVGLPLGLWALGVLARKDVRRAFDQGAMLAGESTSRTAPRFSQAAVASATLALLAILTSAAGFFVWRNVTWPPGPAVLVMALQLLAAGTAPLLAMVLGWIAWEDIRGSKGRLKGCGLAAFALLLPFTRKCLWWLERDGLGLTMEVAFAVNLAWSLLICGGIALWIHHQETQRFRSDKGASRWWLHAPSVRWAVVGIALFVLLDLLPPTPRTIHAENSSAATTPAPGGEDTRSVSFSPMVSQSGLSLH
jgi:hypothetical protein